MPFRRWWVGAVFSVPICIRVLLSNGDQRNLLFQGWAGQQGLPSLRVDFSKRGRLGSCRFQKLKILETTASVTHRLHYLQKRSRTGKPAVLERDGKKSEHCSITLVFSLIDVLCMFIA